MNKWQAIRALYAEHREEIMELPANEWATFFRYFCWDGLIEMTPIEEWIWEEVRASQAVLYPQWPVGRFFVDFGNPQARVAIECDGAAYHTNKEKDKARDDELAEMGWTVYRLTGSECARQTNCENEDAGFARTYIEALATKHKFKRKGAYYLPKLRTEEWRDWLGELPEKVPA